MIVTDDLYRTMKGNDVNMLHMVLNDENKKIQKKRLRRTSGLFCQRVILSRLFCNQHYKYNACFNFIFMWCLTGFPVGTSFVMLKEREEEHEEDGIVPAI